MKVKISPTVDVSDNQRVHLANVLDGKVSRRQATREELKDFIWEEGAGWERVLFHVFSEAFPSDDSDEDLIGGSSDELGDLL